MRRAWRRRNCATRPNSSRRSSPRKRTRAYRRALTALQEELGAWNDAAVAARLAAELAGAASPAAAAFSGWAAAQGAARSAALDNAWAAFARAKPFWSRD